MNAFVSATQIVNRDNHHLLKLNPIVVTIDTNDNFAVQQAVCQLLKQNVVTIFGPNKPAAAAGKWQSQLILFYKNHSFGYYCCVQASPHQFAKKLKFHTLLAHFNHPVLMTSTTPIPTHEICFPLRTCSRMHCMKS